MSQSKSILMPFIIIAVILFGSALAWKMMGKSDEAVETASVQSNQTETQKSSAKPEKQEISIKTYEEPAPMPVTYSEAEKAERKVISKNFMKFSMRYQNKEAVVEGLERYKADGNKDKFEMLAMFAEENYPEIDIPTFE